MRGRTPIYSFNGGELSRRMEGRADLDGIYDRAVAKMLNFVATVEGPTMKRPGFRYVKPAAASASWLTPFIFNTKQSYVIEWGEKSLRFYTNGGRIENGAGAPLEIIAPYTAAEAPRVSTAQSYDRLYMAHPAHAPHLLARTGAETFAIAKIPLKNGPYKDWNTDKAITLNWAGSGAIDGIATITCNRPIFQPGHVGGAFIFETLDFRDIAAWEPGVQSTAIAIGALRRSDGKVYSVVDKKGGGSAQPYTGSIQPVHTEGEEWDGSGDVIAGTVDNVYGVKWRYEYDRFGAGTITEVLSATSAKIKVTRRLPTLATNTYKWAHGFFSDAEGWPQLVCVWGQRLVFIKGTELAASVVGDFFNFAPLDSSGLYTPDMAFRRPLGIADPPLWVHADKEFLLAGCGRNEVMVGQINRAAGISSDNLMAQPQSGYGSTECWPVPIGTGIVFVQRGGRKIREAAFGYQQERFVGANLNIFSRHITRTGIEWLTFQQEPEEMLWGGRGDGSLVAHPHSPEQQVKGFSRVELGAGSALAGCSIPSEDGERDELWILGELGGAKAVLRLADWWDEDAGLTIADACFSDWSVSYDGPPLATFTTGLEHLEGRAVKILADGAIVTGKTVTGGSVTLPKPASKVHIGIGYQARLKLLRPEIRGTQTAQGLRKRLVRILARLIDSGPLRILGRDGTADSMFDRQNGLPMGEAAPLFNGDTDNKPAGNGSDFDVAAELVSDDPLPCTVSMAIATYDLEEIQR